jgi:aldose 1-epimerase
MRLALLSLALLGQLSCTSSMTTHASAPGRGITKSAFGTLADGTPVDLFTLRNSSGIEARVMTYGGIIVSLRTPDRSGTLGDVVLGFDSLASYVHDSPYFGAIVGRYANRIAKGRFTLDGRTYQLPVNNPPNSLLGGVWGFDMVVWDAAPFDRADGVGVVLSHVSPDGDQGYPGTLQLSATFTLTESDELRVDYRATTDKPTIANITNHSYFNLAGPASGRSATELVVTMPADSYTPVDKTLIPTGEFRSVAGTPFDFRSPRRVADRVRDGRDEQLRIGRGYDHNWVVTRAPTADVHRMALVEDPVSGRVMEILSNQPGVQFYTGNFLDGTAVGKGGTIYRQGDGLCFEPQVFPDTPNKPEFGSARVEPGKPYENRIVYRFSVRR